MLQDIGVVASQGVWVDGRSMVLGGRCQLEMRWLRAACETSQLKTENNDKGRIL